MLWRVGELDWAENMAGPLCGYSAVPIGAKNEGREYGRRLGYGRPGIEPYDSCVS